MILLVMAGSWFTLLLGWELIGITSFLLINFWTSKVTTLKSAFKAFVFNKISDAALILAVCLSFSAGYNYVNSGSAFIGHLASTSIFFGHISLSYASLFLFLLIVASCCKSAQFGLHFWLPDSMEAPVPASALIHSATLVSAGIYLLLRFNGLFLVCSSLELMFSMLTAFTAFYGAVIASFQTDVKKILAYSTISHCGMLMFSVLMHQPYVTIFYLFAHGFFKSINFMCVGNFIQASNNYQDMSRMGNFYALFKFEFYFFVITLFNLSSGPLFFCFFSKHWLMGFAYTNGLLTSLSVCFLYAAAFCGMFYSSKLLYECTLSVKRAHHSVYVTHSIESNLYLYRRSNTLSRVAMGVLFAVAFTLIYCIWSVAYLDITGIQDDYFTLTQTPVSGAFYAIHIWFSMALVLIASGYIAFKRGYSYLILSIPVIALIAISAAIV